jgi:Tat protein translocase TatB subunit
VFGIGAQEMVIIGLLLLVVFGPGKLPGMARDFGRFVSEARRSVEEFKEDLATEQFASEEEDGREPREGQGVEASREPEENVGHEEGAAVVRSAPPTE